MMHEETDSAANLSQSVVDDLKNFENKLRDETSKDLITIAYEKEANQ